MVKEKLKKFHDGLFKKEVITSNKKRVLFLIVFYLTVVSIFVTVIGQLPKISAAGATKLFQLGWPIILIPMIFLDYKHFLRCFTTIFLVSLPFLIYVLILIPFGYSTINYQGTTYIFIALLIFLEGMFLGKYYNGGFIKSIGFSYLFAAFIYAIFVYIERLHGHVGDTEIYAFDDKNSAGPIFLVAALLPFMIFRKNSIITVGLKILNFCGFSLIIFLAKCRATLVFLPAALLLIHILLPKSKKMKIISTVLLGGLMAVGIVIIFTVPSLYQRIIVHVILNDKKTIEEAFSGRIEQITKAIDLLKDTKILLFGKGSYYIDCMPISILLTYGLIGTILVLPIFGLPLYSILRSKKYLNNKTGFFGVFFIVLLSLYFNGLFEGYGFIGTGTKVFILWLISGYSYSFIIEDVKNKHLCNVVDKPARFTMRLKPKYFSLLLFTVILAGSCGVLASTSTTEYVGANVFKLLPLSKKTAPLISEKSVDVDKPFFKKYLNGSMCVGQEIKFKTISNPIEIDDKRESWEKGWTYPQCYDIINPAKGIIKATNVTPSNKVTTLCVHTTSTKNSKYIQFPINNINSYSFNHIYIDNVPIDYSFSTLDNHEDIDNTQIEINIKQGCTSKIYYDKFYFPEVSGTTSFEFKSSDSDVATIDNNGIVKANKAGECYISGQGKVNSKTFDTSNKIKIIVTDFSPVPVIDVGFNLEKMDQYISYKLNDYIQFRGSSGECSDKSYDLKITQSSLPVINNVYKFNEETSELKFLKSGEYDIEVISRYDQDKHATRHVVVEPNSPVKISADLDWAVVGNKYDVTQLGLKLYFNRGWKYLEDSDLYYDYHSSVRAGRVTSTKSGFCSGSLTSFQAIKSGTFSYKYVCKYPGAVTYTLKITTSIYTKPEYIQICQNIGLICIFVILALSTLYLFCIHINNGFLYVLLAGGFASLITIMTILFYQLNQITIGCIVVFSAAVLIVSLIRLTALNNKHIGLISDDQSDFK